MSSSAREPVFREPWQAKTFALVHSLHERGVFTWPEWTSALAARIAEVGDSGVGGEYYEHWLQTLNELLASKGVTTTAELARWRRAWSNAIDRTPHGTAVTLQINDFY
jgi:nitrile hydratase accessory protein